VQDLQKKPGDIRLAAHDWKRQGKLLFSWKPYSGVYSNQGMRILQRLDPIWKANFF
jgi:hypothetical protein